MNMSVKIEVLFIMFLVTFSTILPGKIILDKSARSYFMNSMALAASYTRFCMGAGSVTLSGTSVALKAHCIYILRFAVHASEFMTAVAIHTGHHPHFSIVRSCRQLFGFLLMACAAKDILVLRF